MFYVLFVSLILNIFFIYFSIKFAITIINIQEAIELCLDKIDDKYNRLSQIIKMPVFYDSPEIKRVIGEINSIQDDILEVASVLSSSVKNNKNADDLDDLKETEE